ncbi:hypothetical protein HDU79_007288 [Rhizoclosmatium sp. JEL0117]|nr:hypothetical protein HDU79_007288 [Rhizoclosmatium sp. JEL0117]
MFEFNTEISPVFLSANELFGALEILALGLAGSPSTCVTLVLMELCMSYLRPLSTAIGAASVEFHESTSVKLLWVKDIARELRFWLRILQLALTFGAFAGLSVGTFRANYMSSVLSTAGINFMAFTSISSGFVSISWIIVYLNPSTLGIAPHKHARISRIEVLIDLFFLSLWFAASVNLAYHIDMACPAKDHSCLSWDLALVFGYACGGGFALMGGLGVGDLRTHGWGFGDVVGRAVEARGGWVPERVARRMKDGVDEFED